MNRPDLHVQLFAAGVAVDADSRVISGTIAYSAPDPVMAATSNPAASRLGHRPRESSCWWTMTSPSLSGSCCT